MLLRYAVPYYRVSTARQGRSGLGIEAQRSAVHRVAKAEGITLLPEHVEVETGKGSDALDRRPQLAAALAAARSARCPVLVAKLDRLSRDVGQCRTCWPEQSGSPLQGFLRREEPTRSPLAACAAARTEGPGERPGGCRPHEFQKGLG